MRKSFLLLALLTSCFVNNEDVLVQGVSPKKQRQKIAFLQKKLQLAEKDQKKVESEIEKLVSEIDHAELSLIRRQVDEYERSEKKLPSFFLEEREILYRIIQTGPSLAALEAQVELDRILRIITELGDNV